MAEELDQKIKEAVDKAMKGLDKRVASAVAKALQEQEPRMANTNEGRNKQPPATAP